MDENERTSPYFINVPPLGLETKPPEYVTKRKSYQRPLSGEYTPEQGSWYQDLKINRPQIFSMAAAVAVFTSGGMNLAWSLGFSSSTHSQYFSVKVSHVQICWFLAVIIGACIAVIFIDILPKRILNLWASGLVLVNGILFVSSGSTTAFIFARYFDGIAVGLTTVAAVVAGSEQATRRFRGLILSSESVGIMTGVLFRTIIASTFQDYYNEFSSNQMQGVLSLALGVIAAVCTCFLTIESPVFFLRRAEDDAAWDTLQKLQAPASGQGEPYSQLYDSKDLLNEDMSRGHVKNMARSYVPLLKLCFYRALVALSFSVPLNWCLFLATSYTGSYYSTWWSAYICGIMRFLGAVVSAFTVDTLGRRWPATVAMFVGSGLLFGVGAVIDGAYRDGTSQAILGLLLVYQFLAGMTAPVGTIYLAEAFSVSVKPLFILITVILENVVQIIVCCSFEYATDSAQGFLFALASLQLVFALSFFCILPETKQTCLRDALRKFKRNFNVEPIRCVSKKLLDCCYEWDHEAEDK